MKKQMLPEQAFWLEALFLLLLYNLNKTPLLMFFFKKSLNEEGINSMLPIGWINILLLLTI